MRLPYKAISRAVLIGNGTYTSGDLPDIGAVGDCLADLATVLTGTPDAPFAPEHCSILADQAEPARVHQVLNERAGEAEDVLLVYYVGRGLLDEENEFHLGLRNTTRADVRVSGLPFELLYRTLAESGAATKIVILDCGYDSSVADGLTNRVLGIGPARGMGGDGGLYFLMSRADEVSWSDSYPALTGELLRTLVNGVLDGPELLTLPAIHEHLRVTMRALSRASPRSTQVGDLTQLGLVRNRVFTPPTSSALPSTSPPGSRAFRTETPAGPGDEAEPEPDRPEEEMELTADAAATLDLLERGPVATLIAMRLVEAWRAEPRLSFFTHVDGSWGSGKSTMLNLLRVRLAEHFEIVEFDAWQQSRLGPPWWSLLTATRRQVLRGRPWLRVRETASRMRRTGAPFGLALVLVLAVAAVVAYLLWPDQHSLRNWSENVKALIAIAAALGTLVTSALVASRFLLFDSVRGARLFEQTQANPIREIAAHFRWLLRHSRKPVAFFVDDLDRCQQAYVVDFLDTAQTMIRDASQERAAYFVVAADGPWLRRSYEKAHADFAESLERPGRPIGYLFLDKLFQLTIPMPVLTGAAQAVYLDAILRIDRPRPGRVEGTASSVGTTAMIPDPDGLRERLRAFAEGRARQFAHVHESAEERRRTEHILRRFSHLLGNNPRSVKRFLNTYGILHSIRRLEGNPISSETLALWTILVIRWPAVAAHLQDDPEAVQGIMRPLWIKEHFPEALWELACSPEVRDIMTCETGGPLTAAAIRQCVGLSLGGG